MSAYLLRFLFCFLFLWAPGDGKFDPKNPDNEEYCKQSCKEGGKVYQNTGCKCSVVPPREEIVDEPSIVEFRQKVLDLHNFYRNKQAMGEENRTTFAPAAANMLALNYDLECEYVARCYAINSFSKKDDATSAHDKCRTDSTGHPMGQNLGGKKPPTEEMFLKGVHNWYNEVEWIQEGTVDSYSNKPSSPGKKIGHWAQTVWAETEFVGCVRATNFENRKDWHHYIICNYRSEKPRYGCVVSNWKVYEKGEPCSKCPNGTKCESEKYPGLCGKLYPATTDHPPGTPGGNGGSGGSGGSGGTGGVVGFTANKFVVILALLFIIFA